MTRYVKILNALGLPLDLEARLEAFVTLFQRWNAKINLSAARTLTELDEHVVDCLHIVPHLHVNARVLDVGSGGGFPVAIAAICRPETRFSSLEPVHKKHSFLRTVARELHLSNLNPFAVRLEDHEIFDYDLAMSRATFDLHEWFAEGRRRVRDGGAVLGFEGQIRTDLPANVERFPYVLGDKTRSILRLKT